MTTEKYNKIYFPPKWTETIVHKENCKNFIYFEKKFKNFNFQFIETVSQYWVMGLIRIEKGFLNIKINSSVQRFNPGTYRFFYPPYSIVEYDGYLEHCNLSVISSNEKIENLPKEAIGFLSSQNDMSISLGKNIDIIRNVSDPIIIARNTDPSNISYYIKKMIDDNYLNNITFSEIANKLRISQELLSIYFKKNFHLKPVEYRTKLRFVHAIKLLLNAKKSSQKVIDIAQDVGFTDLSHFNRQFKNYTGFSPRFFMK